MGNAEGGRVPWVGETDEVTRAWVPVTAPGEWGVTRVTEMPVAKMLHTEVEISGKGLFYFILFLYDYFIFSFLVSTFHGMPQQNCHNPRMSTATETAVSRHILPPRCFCSTTFHDMP